MSVLITIVYAALLAGGFSVGMKVLWQGFRRPGKLLNPLFANRHALRLFAVHIFVVSADLFVIGPLAVAHKSTLWYWGGLVAVLSCSLPIVTYLNRNPQSFGQLIGHWVQFRNLFEIGLHVALAAMAVKWFHYYLLLWWIVAYRYLDVGPRRLMQRLYRTPEKKAARPWAPILNWVVITVLYGLTFLAVYNRKILFAKVPGRNVPVHVARPYEIALVLSFNIVVAVAAWVMTKTYTQSLLPQVAPPHGPPAQPGPPSPAPAPAAGPSQPPPAATVPMVALDPESRDRRVARVLEHVRLENAHDFPGCIALFARPRYEIVATNQVYDGAAAVEAFQRDDLKGFPDFRFEAGKILAGDEAVLVEGSFIGTHGGTWYGLPATGQTVNFRMAVLFEFEGDAMVCERVYFDLGAPLRQLGVAFDPLSVKGRLSTAANHPVTIAKAIFRKLRPGAAEAQSQAAP